MLKSLILTVLTLFVLATACSRQQPKPPQAGKNWGSVITNPTLTEHENHREEWYRKRPKHYRYAVRLQCSDCIPATFNSSAPRSKSSVNKWLFIEMRDGKTLSAKNIDGSDQQYYQVMTRGSDFIEIGFDWMARSLREKHEMAYALYDSEFSFPRYLKNVPGQNAPTHSDYELEIIEFEVIQDDAK